MRAACVALDLWFKSIRLQPAPPSTLPNSIVVLWHESLLLGLFYFRHQDLRILMSQSKDGDWGTVLSEYWGYKVYRGSNSKGSVSLKNVSRDIEKQKEGNSPARAGMALDGPRGPYHTPKKGTFWLSKKNHLPVIAFSVEKGIYWKLKNWDRTILPFPFSRVKIQVSEAFFPHSTAEIVKKLSTL